MRQLTRLFWAPIVVVGSIAADRPDPVGKATTPKAAGQVKSAGGGPGTQGAGAGQSKPKASLDPRATSLFRSAQNLEKGGKKPGAIGLYRDVLIKYPESPEATEAATRLKALGGKIPTPAEINPAAPAEEAKFTRAPKPKYASQAANRAALNEAVGGMVNGAASSPAGGGGAGAGAGGYGTQGGYR